MCDNTAYNANAARVTKPRYAVFDSNPIGLLTLDAHSVEYLTHSNISTPAIWAIKTGSRIYTTDQRECFYLLVYTEFCSKFVLGHRYPLYLIILSTWSSHVFDVREISQPDDGISAHISLAQKWGWRG